MSLNILTLGSGKSYANQVAIGISSMRVSGTTVYFTLVDTGEEVSVTLPTPADGKDGISITNVEVNSSNQLIVTLSDGNTVNAGTIQTIKGDKGDKGNPGEKGDPGNPGYTPVKGTDYWTSEDISEIQSYIDTQIGGALNGSY